MRSTWTDRVPFSPSGKFLRSLFLALAVLVQCLIWTGYLQPARADYWTAVQCVPNSSPYAKEETATLASVACVNADLGPNFCETSYSADGQYFYRNYCSAVTGGVVASVGAHLHCEDTTVPLGEGKASGFCQSADSGRRKQANCPGQAANPVELHDGNKVQEFLDWSSGGAFPLTFERSYAADFRVDFAPRTSMFGLGWRSNFDAYAKYVIGSGSTLPATPATGNRIHFAMPDGFAIHFVYNSGQWKHVLPRYSGGSIVWDRFRTDVRYSLTVTASAVELRYDDDALYRFDSLGQLQEIRLPSGLVQKIESSNGLPTKVTDSLGRWMEFEYSTSFEINPLLTKVKAYDGKELGFTYVNRFTQPPGSTSKVEQILKSVSFPDATPANAADNPKQLFTYALLAPATGFNLPNYTPLSSITDEKGVVYASWTYNSHGRVASSSHIGGNDTFTFTYDETLNKTTVTNPLGRQTVYSYTKLTGNRYNLASVDGISTANCAASNATYAYDANGFRSQLTDAEGRVTKWTNDTLGRPTSITKGFGTPLAQTDTMTWHATRPLVTQLVQPGLTTGITYNTDGQVASVTETDTTTTTLPYSTAGQVRTTTFGYTAFGMPATPAVTAPVTPLADVVLTVSNPGAATNTYGWTNQTGAIGRRTTAPCSTTNACFFGGTAASTIAYQDITLPAAVLTTVDANQRAAVVTWKQAGFAGDTDQATVRVQFLDAANAVMSSGVDPFINIQPWTTRTITAPVPTGARKIRLHMSMKRNDGTNNDGYVDDITLKLVTDGTASATPFLRLANPSADPATITGWTQEPPSPAPAGVDKGGCAYFGCFRDASPNNDAIHQTIDIPAAFTSSIDANARRIEAGWLEFIDKSPNNFAIELTFLDSAGVALAGTSPKQSVIAGFSDSWTRKSYATDVPVGTRKIKFRARFLTGVPGQKINLVFATGFTLKLTGRNAVPAAVNLLTSVNGPLAGTSDTTTYGYDTTGRISSITNEVGHVTQVLAYTANGLPATIRDANGVDTVLTYNARDWLSTVTVNPGANQAVTTIDYDAIGQVLKVTEADGSFLQYTYNDARRLTSILNNLGESATYTHNVNGDVTSATVRSATNVITQQMSQTYDELGRLLKSIGAASQETVFSYDRTDLTVQVKDPRNNLYGYAYDAVARLVRETDEEGSQVNLTHNGKHEVATYADPRNLTTTYVRNGFGEVIQEASPDAGVTVSVRDARGLVTQETDGRGVVTNSTYDAAGRLLTETYPAAAAENVTYTYDSITGGNFGKGELTSVTDQSGSSSFVYDALGRVITHTRVVAGKSYVTAYTYNAAGRVTGITYPSGRILAITRNSVGQVTGATMKKNATAAVESVASALAFQPLSDQLATLTHGNGLVSNALYDLDGRLTQLQVKDGTTLVTGFGLAYSDGLNLTGITDQVTAANSNVLGYTPANRLASASGVWGNKAYSYDGVGNRITDVTTGGASISRTQYYSNTSNRLNDIWENGASLRVYTYDGAGNTLTETRPGEAFAYSYNKRNRLASVTRNGSLWGAYVYNAFEQLVSRTSPAPAAPLGTVHYIHDLDGHLIAEADGGTGATLRDYVWLPSNDNEVQDLPLAVIDGVNTASPVTSFIHTDHLGRPTRMTNAAKATVWQAVWTPWGEAQSMTGSVTNNLRFPGQYFQIETNLHYNHHRTYDPVTGRYTQPDPLGFVDGPSVYAYAGNSPWMNVDREGQSIWRAVEPTARHGKRALGIFLGGMGFEFLTNRCATLGDATVAGATDLVLGGGGLALGKKILKMLRTGVSRSADGIVYKRFHPKTGDEYVGQVKSPERFDVRRKEHNAKLGTQHDYEVLGRAPPGKKLDVLEEDMIRTQGGLQKEGGTLLNRRHQMREERYREHGGKK